MTRPTLMLAAYNAGPYKVIDARGVPAIPETKNYVVVDPAARADLHRADRVGADVVCCGRRDRLRLPAPRHPVRVGRHRSRRALRLLRADAGGLRLRGVKLPRTSREQWYAGQHVSRDQLQPGDLVFFANNLNDPRTIHHVGIYVGNGYMIDAPHTGAVIRFDPVDQPDYIGAVRPTEPPTS